MDAVLIRNIKKGDEAIFAAVYHAYQNKLYYFFLKKLSAATMCDELVQETFIRLWNYRSSLDENLSFSLQLFRIAKTILIDLLRKEARNRMIIVPLENADTMPVPVEDPAGGTFHEKVTYLKNSLRTMPPMRRRIVEYRMDGLSNQEIADELSISRKTVENHINKAFNEIKSKADLPLFLILLLFPFLY